MAWARRAQRERTEGDGQRGSIARSGRDGVATREAQLGGRGRMVRCLRGAVVAGLLSPTSGGCAVACVSMSGA